jgi:ABC-type sugar transport system substrate-binding protein
MNGEKPVKKSLVVLLAVSALLVGACQASATPAPAASAAVPTVVASTAPASAGATPAASVALAAGRRVAFFVPWTQDIWYVVGIQGAKEMAASFGIQLDVYDANNKVETQIQQFDTALATNPEAIVLSSVDPAGMVPSIEKAHDQGIKVVVYDRPIYATTKMDGLVVLDTTNLGDIACKSVVKALTDKYGSPKGTVVRAYGDLADTWVTGISTGWDPCISQYPDIKVLKASSGQWDPVQSAANVSQLLASHPEIDAITLDSDFLATGILTDLKTGSYGKVGEPKHIYMIGDGGTNEALQAIRDGWMDATINNPVPDFTGAAVKFADMLANGQPIPQQWVEPGKAWSPATITNNVPAANAPYAGPVLNMKNFVVDKSTVDDPTLWGNIAAKTK